MRTNGTWGAIATACLCSTAYLLFGVGGEARGMQVVRVEAGRAGVPVACGARAKRLRVVQPNIYCVAHLRM